MPVATSVRSRDEVLQVEAHKPTMAVSSHYDSRILVQRLLSNLSNHAMKQHQNGNTEITALF